ncbi:hypothetical protein SQW15_18965 [Pseudomonas asiatica]|uniref:hypothetical protein n=1 Tax=Pseudomonas asiatica TaxID=2219225 RepID=UPI001FBB77AB|nr:MULTISPECIES: hypothetical protein [Pseudomonas]WPU58776.1 hypothetical protein SQW15_18965 [Pseudomonas asiatica]
MLTRVVTPMFHSVGESNQVKFVIEVDFADQRAGNWLLPIVVREAIDKVMRHNGNLEPFLHHAGSDVDGNGRFADTTLGTGDRQDLATRAVLHLRDWFGEP